MSLDARATIEQLRERIRHIEGREPVHASFVPTGWDAIDRLLPGGGVPRGALSELSGGRASGKTAVALSALGRSMASEGSLAAFVDGRHELYPPAVAAAGVPLERLLVVRPDEGDPVAACKSGLWAAEALLASGAFEAVAIDVPAEILARHGSAAAALQGMLHRVRAAVEKGGAVALWLGVPEGPRVSPAVRLEFTTTSTGWRVHRAHARTTTDHPSGHRAATVEIHAA